MSIINGVKIKLFTLNSNKPLAEKISKSLGVELGKCTVKKFADGEVSVDIDETVRGHHVFVVQSTSNPVNEHLMELLIMIDALKRASAKSINVIMPYYGYSRQDRKASSRQPISAKLVADLLQAAGTTRALSVDLHASQIQGFFNIPIDNFQAIPIISEYIIKKKLDNIVVVSPDHGGTARARKLAEILNAPLAIVDKRRPQPNVSEVMNIIGEVEGKTAVIIDDMIDTAGSICNAAEALVRIGGATDVYAACTHAIFSGPAIERLEKSVIKEVIVTNTIDLDENKKISKVKQICIGDLIGQGIGRIIRDEPISALFDVKKDC